jgi:adenylate cyclase, class 2
MPNTDPTRDTAPKMNIEIKVHVDDLDAVRERVRALDADFLGADRQRDTYFKVSRGRLKLREGTVEACLVFYVRPDTAGPRRCDYELCSFTPGDSVLPLIRRVLAAALGVRAVVEKNREIYYVGAVKIHLDEVIGLGSFAELEVIGREGDDPAMLESTCGEFMSLLGLDPTRSEGASYVDLQERYSTTDL